MSNSTSSSTTGGSSSEALPAAVAPTDLDIFVASLEGLSEDGMKERYDEVVAQKRKREQMSTIVEEYKRTHKSPLDILAEQAASMEPGKTTSVAWTEKVATDIDGRHIIVSDKTNAEEIIRDTLYLRRMMFPELYEYLLQKNGTAMDAKKAFEIIKAHAYDHMDTLAKYHEIQSNQDDLDKLGIWATSSLVIELACYTVMMNPELLERAAAWNFVEGRSDLLSIAHYGHVNNGSNLRGLSQSEAINRLISWLEGFDTFNACLFCIHWYRASDPLISRIRRGDLQVRDMAWVYYEIHSAICAFKRLMNFPIQVNGVLVPIKHPPK